MPLAGEHHTFYWENTDTVTTPVIVSRGGGYPAWQSTVVVVGSGFGGAVEYVERFWDAVRWLWRLFRRSLGFDAQRRAVVLRVLSALEHPAYPIAQRAVKQTATTLGFNRPEAWKELSRELKTSPGRAENAFRHLEAMRLVRANLLSSTVTNPECNLIVELAYHGFASVAVGSSKA